LINNLGTTGWMHLGTLNTLQEGRCSKFDIFFTDGFNGISTQLKHCSLFFVSSNGSSGYTGSNYVGGSNFKAMCTAIGSDSFPEIRIKEISSTEYEFWYYSPQYAGVGVLEVSTNDTFTFIGIRKTEPTTPYFNPIYNYKVDVGGLIVDKVSSYLVETSGVLLKLKGGSSGTQVLDENNNVLVSFNSF
jgi:hypothetical protein